MSECRAVTRSGRACRAATVSGGSYCFSHEPSLASKRRAARALGGRAHGSHGGGSAPSQVRSIDDVLSLLDYALTELIRLDNGVQRGRTLIALGSAYIEALQIGSLEERMTSIEQALANLKR